MQQGIFDMRHGYLLTGRQGFRETRDLPGKIFDVSKALLDLIETGHFARIWGHFLCHVQGELKGGRGGGDGPFVLNSRGQFLF